MKAKPKTKRTIVVTSQVSTTNEVPNGNSKLNKDKMVNKKKKKKKFKLQDYEQIVKIMSLENEMADKEHKLFLALKKDALNNRMSLQTLNILFVLVEHYEEYERYEKSIEGKEKTGIDILAPTPHLFTGDLRNKYVKKFGIDIRKSLYNLYERFEENDFVTKRTIFASDDPERTQSGHHYHVYITPTEKARFLIKIVRRHYK